MKAVIFDEALRYVPDQAEPEARPGWRRIRVTTAGICKTDLEIVKGYMGFRGILGHEFVGRIEAPDGRPGARVVGEINAACGVCDRCAQGLGRHCPKRSTLGIFNLDGCMAEVCVLPAANLVKVPDELPDDRAVLIEPLSAACEILEQHPLRGSERVIVLGDGKLGLLCAWVLSTAAAEVTLVGKHPEKLAQAGWRTLRTALADEPIAPGADLVVEATGSAAGLARAIELCRPRGAIALKSTVAAPHQLSLAPVVINEITLFGSRCGQFQDGLAWLARYPDAPLERLIAARYPIDQALEAFHQAAGTSLKVLLDIGG
ncbi:MAG: alcohol dehydrogenase catalytic domain-containing protein [Candidatus Marinimicrobia bacterium]|nr:alcohol dehydrogenase catalytic domain-containing protein [Candidatus Neomarinimicrobiota bacterium]